MMRNFHLALRSLGRSPGFTITVVLTLALGVGANTAMFRTIDHVLLRPLPYPEANRLVALHETQTGKGFRPVSLPNLLDWRAQSTAFEAMAGYMKRSFGLQGGSGDGSSPVFVIQVGMTTSDLFRVLGKGPLMGRSFTEREEGDRAGVIVLTDSLWARQFGRDPKIVGRTVQLNEEPRTVIGVLAPDFEFPIQGTVLDAFIPINHGDYGGRGVRPLEAVARLKPGITIENARTQIRTIGSRLAQAWPQENHDGGADVESLDESWKGGSRKPLGLLMAAALLLAGIACANVISLMLARSLARQRETAVRISLGAGLRQLMGESLAESLLLSAGGGVAAMAVSLGCLRLIPGVAARFGASVSLVEIGSAGLNASAIGFTTLAALAVALVCGIVPAVFASGATRTSLLRSGGPAGSQSTRGQVRFRRALVVAQVSASLILLLSSGLFLRVFLKLVSTHPGFDSAQVYYFGFGLPESRYDERKMVEFHRALSSRLMAIPGVESAGAAWWLPLNGRNITTTFQFEGTGAPQVEWPWVAVNAVDPGYFETLRIPLLSGRSFSWATDLPDRPPAVMVNRTFERTYGKVLGRRVRLRWRTDLNPAGQLWEIVGVVGDTHQVGMDKAVRPQVYIPVSRAGLDGGGYVLRTARTDAGLAVEAAKAVESVDPALERIRLRLLDGWVRESLSERRAPALLTGLFAGVALLLTAIGLYGVVAFQVEQRRHEIAIRIALGARTGSVSRMVAMQGLALVVAGAVVGTGAFWWLGQILRSQLYGVETGDPVTVAAVTAVLATCGLAACWAPARSAARTEPMRLLR